MIIIQEKKIIKMNLQSEFSEIKKNEKKMNEKNYNIWC